MSSKSERVKLGISIGDINGIGPEVILKSLNDSRMLSNICPIIYASEKLIKFVAKYHGLSELAFHFTDSAEKINLKKINVVNTWNEDVRVNFGAINESGGKYAFLSLKKAVEDLASTKFDALVTAPINKKNIQSEDFKFPGHTEYLANYSNEENPLMLMAYQNLRVGTLTGHIPLKSVSEQINTTKIIAKLEVFEKSLIQDFNIRKPKIAVLGLNPHSGDQGLLGDEEQKIIEPALNEAKEKGFLAFGPYAADGFFASSSYKNFDGILAMYHDQGLIPFKAISAGEGVNYTAGLPIVRTSPDHGTAFDIAGKNLADPASFRNAIYEAIDIFKTRKEFKNLQANKLTSEQATNN